MARMKVQKNGRLASLVQNQAVFLAQMADINRDIAEMQRINTERFARIEAILNGAQPHPCRAQPIFAEHSRILQALSDTIRKEQTVRNPRSSFVFTRSRHNPAQQLQAKEKD